jgi:ATP-dependent DNA ligase
VPGKVGTRRPCDGESALILQRGYKLDLEGTVSKRADAPYCSGNRPEWIKTTCATRREANRDRFEKMDKQD